ncbi:MAG TPA: CoA transferase, partial [Rhizobiales bacterium]|nr:CoA transferase [Hyphomicrobiales bacterium]
MQPLDNIKVLDFSTLLPGPLAGLVLAEAGAQVIKVERPGFGEEMRHYPPKWGDQSANFALLNRGKKSLTVDLKDKLQIEQLKPLICEADILLEQFRPGVMARLGLDYETVKGWNPGLIYCSITGYGQSGPKAQLAGHDLNYIGDTGLLDLSMGPADKPTIPPALIADIGGGTYPALVNILLA